MANYSFGFKPLPAAQDGDVFEKCNFAQLAPHTPIFAGVRNLTFRDCNLMNCDLPPDAKVECCLSGAHISFCSHLHPEFPLEPCADNCEHVVGTDEIKVNGVIVETVYQYEDKRV